jgi:hypothetical protein
MTYDKTRRVGICGICGGFVVKPLSAPKSSTPTAHCARCGATVKERQPQLPILEMVGGDDGRECSD